MGPQREWLTAGGGRGRVAAGGGVEGCTVRSRRWMERDVYCGLQGTRYTAGLHLLYSARHFSFSRSIFCFLHRTVLYKRVYYEYDNKKIIKIK